MSRSAEITFDWADGTHKFALKLGQLAELQEKCEAGPWYIQWALQSAMMASTMGLPPPKDASAAYVIETIRLGLIGGGMDPLTALKKVRAYVSEGQITENIVPAYSIISVALQGVPEDEPEKPEGDGETSAKPCPEESSDSHKSTAPAPQSD